MLVTFDFLPEEDHSTTLIYTGIYKNRNGNCFLSLTQMSAILTSSGLSVDFEAGRYLYRTKIPEGAIVTPPQMVLIWIPYYEGVEQFLTDGSPNLPELSVVGIGGRFEVDAPLSVAKRYRRFAMSVVEDASLLPRSLQFLSPSRMKSQDHLVPVPIPAWFHKLATLCGGYPFLPVKWIAQTRVQYAN